MTRPVPVLFLDVDGPLLPFGGARPAPSSADADNPLLPRLDAGLGPRLLSLGCDLVWATTWQDEANEVVAPRLGLPALPVVRWPEDPDGTGPPGTPRGLHWKTPALAAWAGDRPFLWVDDEIGPVDRLWVEGVHPAPALLHRVDPRRGLTGGDLAVLAAFVGGLGAA
ncbi:HAD domain-containing protein [Streptomyces fragilis]|uniref:HAD domain-containing protein n=1 Tax=Streptomyces fragilis TaxID=67301 RepID=A0ABV2YJF9_9ACTN|nr:HAD domain-containing protein [Streptomyces fragilis]